MAAHHVWRQAFLTALGQCGIVTTACDIAKVHKTTAFAARKTDSAFAQQWTEAMNTAADTLEAEAIRRARDGFDEPVFFRGKEVGVVRRYSDLLLIFMLKSMRPERFREKVYVSTDQLDELIERELRKAKGEDLPEANEEATALM